MRSEGVIAGVIAAAAALVVCWSVLSLPSEAAQPAPSDPRFFDLSLAERELSTIETERGALQEEIVEILAGIDGLTSQRDYLDLNQAARADALDAARIDARRIAVAAYVNIGPPLSGFDSLNAETASELSRRNAMLRQQTRRLEQAAEAYALLAGEADANVLALSDEINDETRRLEALRRELSRLTGKVPRAEWFVEIAAIHAEASNELVRFGRVEPTAEQWRELRFCESTENYAVDTGNSFYGAYQFTLETWGTVGGADNPALAPPEEQDARARLLYSQRGAQPWPICGRYLPG